MYPRLIKPPRQKSFFLFGPRGTGKTTWVKTVFPQALYLDLLSVVLFGSLAKGTDFKKSDMDLFILVPSKGKYDEPIEMECVALSRGFGIEINPIISEPASLLSMLKDKEHNVGKEVLKNKIVLFGAEKFWELIFEVIK